MLLLLYNSHAGAHANTLLLIASLHETLSIVFINGLPQLKFDKGILYMCVYIYCVTLLTLIPIYNTVYNK